jgi:uncharacterized membrane protein
MTLWIYKFIHLSVIAVWTGSMVFFSFICAPAVFKTFERDKAGDVVGAIFPAYFMLGEISAIVAALTLALIGIKTGFTPALKGGLVVITLMGGMAAYSGLINGPQARQVKQEIRAESDPAKKETLTKQFKKLHGVSMAVNVTTIVLSFVLLGFAMKYLSAQE